MPFKGISWRDEQDFLEHAGRQGMSQSDLARHYGITRQRIKQVLAQYYPDWEETYGWQVRRSSRVSARQAAFKDRWGVKEDTDLYLAKRSKYQAKKYNAKRAGYEFELEFGDIEFPTHCPILGIELDYFAETRQENSVSFDKVDPSKGYTRGNVIILSWRANRIKNDGTAEEHRQIADYLDTLHNPTLEARAV